MVVKNDGISVYINAYSEEQARSTLTAPPEWQLKFKLITIR